MYKIIIKLVTILLYLMLTTVNAQIFQGQAYYQTKRTMNIQMDSTQMDNPMQKQIQEMLKKQFEKTYVLTFNKNSSIYKEEEQLKSPKSQGIMIIGGVGTLYKNTKTKTFTKKEETFGKKILIKDTIEKIDWKISNETKMIGKYLCIKATAIKMIDDYEKGNDLSKLPKKKEQQKELPIIAWYTPEIPVSNGPEYYGGLPGLILELHEDKMHFVCNKIIFNPKKIIKIVAPTKGKVMSQKEYQKMKEKQLEEMMKKFHGGRKKGKNTDTFFSIGG